MNTNISPMNTEHKSDEHEHKSDEHKCHDSDRCVFNSYLLNIIIDNKYSHLSEHEKEERLKKLMEEYGK